jgi:uncharacterized protein YkwD
MDIMYKQVSIFFFGILFFTAIIQSTRLSQNNKNELVFKYRQQQHRAHSISDNSFETHEPINNVQLIDRVMQSINRRDAFNLYQILKKRNKSGFTGEQSQFQNEMLQAHNDYRSSHCVPSLQLDDNLSRSAQKYAEKLARTNTFRHSGTPGVGENLWMTGSSNQLSAVNDESILFTTDNDAYYHIYERSDTN